MSFPQYVSDAAMTACGRCCCICHKFCGTKIELHHIKQAAYGGEDTFENCIPLCFDCHADMGKADPKHNKGKRYTETELKMHRDKWYSTVAGSASVSKEIVSQMHYVCDEDKRLFMKICESFTPNIRYWLSQENMYSPFDGEKTASLNALLVKNDDPFFSFINPELEEIKQHLFDALDSFLDTVSLNTYVIDNDHPNQYASHAWLFNHDYIEGRGYESYKEAKAAFDEETKLLNKQAADVWAEYCSFVKNGRLIISRSSEVV